MALHQKAAHQASGAASYTSSPGHQQAGPGSWRGFHTVEKRSVAHTDADQPACIPLVYVPRDSVRGLVYAQAFRDVHLNLADI